MHIQIEIVLLVLSILLFVSIFAGKASSRFGVPALLLFLSIGMISGSDGLGIEFENIGFAQTFSTVALCIILFSGGLDTKFNEVRPIIVKGIILATVGVFLTALISGILVWWILGATMGSAAVGISTAMLLASTMSSTDSASVFSILRSRGLKLKNNLRPLLELESGSNDPMAYLLVITFIELIRMGSNPNYWVVGGQLLLQLAVGGLLGYVLGRLSVRLINWIKIGNDSLYPILVFTVCIFVFSATYFLYGNSYLAVYVAGLVIGNSKFIHKLSSLNFFDGLAWMSQLFMFLMLGLLVNPSELIPILVPGLAISLAMIFIARPLAVFTSLLPFYRMPTRDKVYVSWVGLKGAVPIIFAIFTLAADVPHARLIFNIVFLSTLVSLLVQGTSLPAVAKWLHLTERPSRRKRSGDFDLDLLADIRSTSYEIRVTESMLTGGNRLMDLPLPDNTLVVLVKRQENYLIPTGKTQLEVNDNILIITSNQDGLRETLQNLGLDCDP